MVLLGCTRVLSVAMEHSGNSRGVTDFQQLWGSWTTLLDHLYDEPRVLLALFFILLFVCFSIRANNNSCVVSLPQVAQLMKTRVGLYLSCHPFLALTLLLFGAMAALPVGLFLTFALVTFIIAAVGFVFFEGRCTHVRNHISMTLRLHTPRLTVFLSVSVSVPVVCRRVDSAVCALRHRPLLCRGFIHR